MSWIYPAELLDKLLELGVAPRPDTPPRFVRDHLNDLYRYEIRQLRGRLLGNEFPKHEYAARVIDLRGKYWPLSFTPEQWEKICGFAATTSTTPTNDNVTNDKLKDVKE